MGASCPACRNLDCDTTWSNDINKYSKPTQDFTTLLDKNTFTSGILRYLGIYELLPGLHPKKDSDASGQYPMTVHHFATYASGIEGKSSQKQVIYLYAT